MSPLFEWVASGFISGIISGTSGSILKADELSITTAPDLAATGANSFEMLPPALKRAMSTSSNEFNVNSKIQNIDYPWDISTLNLSTEDEIHFNINVSDNNGFDITTTTSNLFIGKYPTLEDLFWEMEANGENIDDYNDDIISNIDEVQELVDELQLDLLKSDELGWEEKQDIDKTIKEMENIFNQSFNQLKQRVYERKCLFLHLILIILLNIPQLLMQQMLIIQLLNLQPVLMEKIFSVLNGFNLFRLELFI